MKLFEHPFVSGFVAPVCTFSLVFLLISGFGSAQEKLTLTTPVSGATTTEWSIEDIYISKTAPAIKATLVSNTGERFVYRYVPSETVTATQVTNAINYINQGKFKTIDGQNLQSWLLTQISAQGVKVGTVSGG